MGCLEQRKVRVDVCSISKFIRMACVSDVNKAENKMVEERK